MNSKMSESVLSNAALQDGAIPIRTKESITQRYLWVLSVSLPLIGLAGIPLHYQLGHTWLLAAPILIAYGAIPLLDIVLGKTDSNFDEATMQAMEQDTFYRHMTYATVAVIYAMFAFIAWYAGTQVNNMVAIALLGISAGFTGGVAINTAHEMGHKMTKIERFLAKLTLAIPAMGHFCVEHNLGHHKHVATPEDHASSRMGETIYAFALREIPGTIKRGIQAEANRLHKLGKSAWHPSNPILQSYLLSAVIYGAILVLFGWKMIPFMLLAIAFSWWQLTSANYIEHYGLLREKNEKGSYESCKPHHSWNANSVLSNRILFQLERHSDHHANPTRRYQVLRNFKDVPELPTGYFGMYIIAYFPSLWFKVMDPLLLDVPHINGDLDKVNTLSKAA